MARIGERVLRDIGLTKNFALVLFLGHGSHSMNNPHRVGARLRACGGAVGGPNGRAIAQVLNDPRVRAILAERGIPIPTDTVFVGGLHNTCNESTSSSRTPTGSRNRTGNCSARPGTRSRRHSAETPTNGTGGSTRPLTVTFTGARQHLDNRAEDLAQVRPGVGPRD